MKTIGYIRVSKDEQDLEKQRHLLLEYSQGHKLLIDEFIDVEISSRKNQSERRITELLAKLEAGDLLLVAELSRLGRNMLETLTGPHTQLLLAIYSYFAEAEREFISVRTKQGLAAARAQGKQLGRPKGSRNRNRPLDPYREPIKAYLQTGLPVASIVKLVNEHLAQPLSYNSFKYFIHQDEDLCALLSD